MLRYVKNPVVKALIVVAVSVQLFGSGTGLAQTPPASTPAAAPAAIPTPDYHPSLGDLMTMSIQPRHSKLGLAGQARNWQYAKYELSELRNGFARVGRTIPTYRNIDMPAVIAAMTTEPLNAVEQAINVGDSSRFTTAYAALTTACNACHQSQDHASVVIQVPRANPYPDQDFRRASK